MSSYISHVLEGPFSVHIRKAATAGDFNMYPLCYNVGAVTITHQIAEEEIYSDLYGGETGTPADIIHKGGRMAIQIESRHYVRNYAMALATSSQGGIAEGRYPHVGGLHKTDGGHFGLMLFCQRPTGPGTDAGNGGANNPMAYLFWMCRTVSWNPSLGLSNGVFRAVIQAIPAHAGEGFDAGGEGELHDGANGTAPPNMINAGALPITATHWGKPYAHEIYRPLYQ